MAENDAREHTEAEDVGLVDSDALPARAAADFRTIYTNMVLVNSSIFDFSVTVCEVIEGNFLEKKVRLVMSPQLAKALMFSMTAQVKRYEDAFAKIEIGSDITRDVAAPTTDSRSIARAQQP